MTWKLLLILGILTLMICASCSTHRGQAAYRLTTPSVQKVTEFCDENKYPAEGEVIEPKKCSPIECDMIWSPERCVNVGE